MNRKSVFKNMLAIGLLVIIPAFSRAASDGAALYKSKCAGCHGAGGEGKPSMKAPVLKGTTLDTDKITHHITNGEPTAKAPHKKGIHGVTEEQAKAIAEFIKTLK